MAHQTLFIKDSYLLDAANFFSVLTGDEFYVSRHRDAYNLWAPRLADRFHAGIATAVAAHGSAMLGPSLSYALSAVPGFATANPAELLADSDLIQHHIPALPTNSDDFGPMIQAICLALAPVAAELHRLGFRDYWTEQRRPLITAATTEMERFLSTLRFDIGAAVAHMLGPDQARSDDAIDLYLCTFASPHGMKLMGRRFVSDVAYPPGTTVRIAIHEMFHPPYRLHAIQETANALIADPLFQESFRTKDPRFGYDTEAAFLEENVVEAMELHISTGAGLMDDPIRYLLQHDDGSHKLSVVLCKYFKQFPKKADEPFPTYLTRLVQQMEIGRLTDEYDQAVQAWRDAGGNL